MKTDNLERSTRGESRTTTVLTQDVCPRLLPPRFFQANRGFTLLELIVVMLLLVTMAGISVPQFRGFVDGQRLQEEGRRFIALSRFARNEAISRSERVELWMSPAKKQYGIRRSPYYQRPNVETTEYTLDEKIALKVEGKWLDKDGSAVIVYWPDGTLEADGVEEFTFEGKEKGVVTIVLDELGVNYEIQADDTNP
jgi:prepilin-type N-terminal cleavage/methylation domain-containing protein